MRFSFWPNVGQPWEEVLARCEHAERTGWDGVWVADHFMPAGGDVSAPMLECWATLAALAARVPRLRLGSLVSSVTYRHPAVLANTAATVDVVSGGRLVLGVGAGWQENEHEAYGLRLGPVGERLDRFEEGCRILRGLLHEPRTTVEGEHFGVADAPLEPKGAGAPIPLLVGGGGEKRTLRIAARYADEWNVWGDPDTLRHKGGVLDRHCEEVGRDPAAIQRSAQALLFLSTDEEWLADKRDGAAGRASIVGTPAEVADIVGAYRDAGVDELIVPDFTLGPRERALDTLDLFMAEVVAAVR